MASLGELFIQLAFEGDTKGAEEFQKSLKKTENTANNMISVMQDLANTVQKLVEVELSKLSETTDNATVSTENNTQTVEENTQSVDENTQTTEENTQSTEENTKATQENTEAKQENSDAENKNAKAKKDNSGSVKKGIMVLRNYALAISGAIYALHRMTDALLKQNQEWLNLTRTSDVALDTFQKWDSVGKTLGVNNAADQIKNLNDRLFELKLTGRGASGFIIAGINPTNAEDVMEQLRNRIKGMDDTSASYILKQMGLDPNMLHILRMSREEFEGINAELKKYRLTAEQRKQMQFFNYQIQIAAQKLEYLKQKVILAILPAWTKFMHSLARVTEGVVKFVGWLKSALDTCPPLVKGILGIVTAVGVLRKALKLLKLEDPFYLTISLITGAIYLLIDDIVGYFQGKDSAIGAILYFFDEIDEKLNSIETPQWVKDILLILQNANALNNIKNGGKEIDKSGLKTINNPFILANPLSGGFVAPALGLTRAFFNNANKTYNNDNRIEQNITINSNQPANDIMANLAYAQNAFAYQYS